MKIYAQSGNGLTLEDALKAIARAQDMIDKVMQEAEDDEFRYLLTSAQQLEEAYNSAFKALSYNLNRAVYDKED